MKIFRTIIFAVISIVLIYLIPFLNIIVVNSNVNGVVACVSICSILSSAAAASSCSTKIFGKRESVWLALVIPSLAISVFVFCVCLGYQYLNRLLINVGWLITFTTVASLLSVILMFITYFKDFSMPISSTEAKEAKELKEKADKEGASNDGLNLRKKGGKK